MSELLTVLAGSRALSRIKSEGFRPDMFDIIAGAAGGPKWLVLNHLDRVIFPAWSVNRTKPVYFIGSSIGAWRFAAATQKEPLAAIDRFQTAYIHQRYSLNPDRAEIARETSHVLDCLLGENGIQEILSHPCFRLNILAVRCQWPTAGDQKCLLGPGLATAFGANLIHRRLLKFFFERTLFYDARNKPPFFNMPGFTLHRVPLIEPSLKQALLASGAIPWLMSGIQNIPGAPKGTYRDGGTLDYHLDIPFSENLDDGLVLFPHYLDRIIPGWFDKKLIRRKPAARHMRDVLLISPSRTFVQSLPYGKIPDKKDFWTFKGRDPERIAYWTAVVDQSRRLSDALHSLLATNRLADVVQPLDTRP